MAESNRYSTAASNPLIGKGLSLAYSRWEVVTGYGPCHVNPTRATGYGHKGTSSRRPSAFRLRPFTSPSTS